MLAYGIVAGMNGGKVPQDDAVTNSFFSTVKKAHIHHAVLYAREKARQLITAYIAGFYTRTRIYLTIANNRGQGGMALT